MSKSVDKASSTNTNSLLSVQNIVLAGVLWGFFALLFYMIFGTRPDPDQPLPIWYTIGTYVFEMVAFLAAALLCFRNWRSPQVVSGRGVWLSISLAMLFYFIGQGVFGYIEIGLKQDPDLSFADIFFTASYICIIWGMCLAVFSKRLSLEIWQWLIVTSIGAVGIAVFVWLTFFQPQQSLSSLFPTFKEFFQLPRPNVTSVSYQVDGGSSLLFWSQPALADPIAQAPAAPPKPAATSPAKPEVPKQSPAATPSVKPAQGKKSPANASPKPTATSPAKPGETPAPAEGEPSQLEWLAKAVQTFYLLSDVFLLVIATMLLLAFWGGRFSMPWRMMAAAAFSFYISDIYFKIASESPNYQSGSLLEVGWVFSGILFGLGAALEHDLSTRSRRTPRRRS